MTIKYWQLEGNYNGGKHDDLSFRHKRTELRYLDCGLINLNKISHSFRFFFIIKISTIKPLKIHIYFCLKVLKVLRLCSSCDLDCVLGWSVYKQTIIENNVKIA